ncbi:hypothetical protein Aoki45_23490 [Algoriphagus sp. oki45]|uniref:hypothetical protein n=1 Tax=Algoriphagus sp. oki45 TaxID=3067294 RepID=UPI0027F227BE|nr:hypothetical protein Aoki45_23490 [Algoriphagus sp. oki45]
MKKSVLAIFFVLVIALSAKGQMQRGSWMVDGQVGISMDRQEDKTSDLAIGTFNSSYQKKGFSLKPGLGYFIQDNLAIGLTPSFGMDWGKGEFTGNSPVKFNSFEYGIGLFSRKYIPAGDKLSFFADLRVGGFWGDIGDIEDGSSNRTILSKNKGLEVGASLGLQYLLSNRFGIHLQSSIVDYRLNKQSAAAIGQSTTTKRLDNGLFSSFQIGATFFF